MGNIFSETDSSATSITMELGRPLSEGSSLGAEAAAFSVDDNFFSDSWWWSSVPFSTDVLSSVSASESFAFKTWRGRGRVPKQSKVQLIDDTRG